MGQMHHFTYGWLTPLLSYVMACVGSALGLRCTVRGLAASGSSRRNWLLTAALAIGSGIWTMHFVAMLGFGVSGSAIRYDVPLTVLSLLVAVLVVGAGIFTVGHGRARSRYLLMGGLGTGVGVAAMHYIGMAALRLHGDVGYDAVLVGLSVVIAVVAATAGLWAALTVHGTAGATVASLVMGLAVSSMHYTGMAAVSVRLSPGQEVLSGATATEFIFPLTVVLGSFLFLTSAFVALSPTAQQRREAESAVRRLHDVEAHGVEVPVP
ncbi:MHYT domain-containing protein [Streptomyces winkii]|uniref:MHYT domain-containing protein n=1 Tax=Streptomyces winkii TaxID=3051178 RepID=UPI0028D46C4C|nr:MHYT domain-containing protein [Streptomyces sp. DSM 40971]